MSSFASTFHIPPDTVDVLQTFMEGMWSLCRNVSETDRNSIELAVVELVSNIIQNNSKKTITCTVAIDIGNDAIAVVISDDGSPVRELPRSRRMPDPHEERGRGLAFVEGVTDSCDYRWEKGINIWELTRSRVPSLL
jgi:serine/threonine-protein kinase RsbW